MIDPATASVIGGIAILLIERVFSRIRKSKCFKCEADFGNDEPKEVVREFRGGALRSPPDPRDLIYEVEHGMTTKK